MSASVRLACRALVRKLGDVGPPTRGTGSLEYCCLHPPFAFYYICRPITRRSARAVYWGSLENCCLLTGTGGSNPSSSIQQSSPIGWAFVVWNRRDSAPGGGSRRRHGSRSCTHDLSWALVVRPKDGPNEIPPVLRRSLTHRVGFCCMESEGLCPRRGFTNKSPSVTKSLESWIYTDGDFNTMYLVALKTFCIRNTLRFIIQLGSFLLIAQSQRNGSL